ncbi:MAG: hemerythrin [Magnetococcales bacterium]|nr:hemerythrin [Magnetococcales bacterium]
MVLNCEDASGRLVWNDELSVGIWMADSDHQEIISLINQVLDAMAAKETDVRLSRRLDELIVFAKQHFQREEELFVRYDYPELRSHREVHRFLENKIMSYKNAFLAGEAELSQTAFLLKDWIVLHIRGVDKKYTRFLHSRGVA